jgi:hypothetical protein
MLTPCPKQRVAKPGGANQSTKIILNNFKLYIKIYYYLKVIIIRYFKAGNINPYLYKCLVVYIGVKEI